MNDLIAVQGVVEGAGSLTYWELNGDCHYDGLCQALQDCCADATLPRKPTLEVAFIRALEGGTKSRHGRHVIRPISRRSASWEVFREDVVDGEDAENGVDKLQLTSIARCAVVKGKVVFTITEASSEADAFRDEVLESVEAHQSVLTATDVSTWLSVAVCSPACFSVALRQRGGFYFVPAGAGLAYWRALKDAVHGATRHRISELPAMRTDECAEAVLRQVRAEAEEAFTEMVAYLSRPAPSSADNVEAVQSRKGLNAIHRSIEVASAKVKRYSDLFQVELTDLEEQAKKLDSAVSMALLALDTKA